MTNQGSHDIMIDETLEKIKKQYGDDAFFLLNQFPETQIDAISTGSLLLDRALGVGGIPRGRFTEVYGVDMSGKSTLCQHLVASAQKQGLVCAFIDVENALDLKYAASCGVEIEALYLAQPDFAEEALGIAEILIKSGEFGLIVIDSIAGLSPAKESEDKKGEGFVDKNVTAMQRAKLLASFFRLTAGAARRNNVAVVFTNQMRDIIGAFFGGIKPAGGWAVKHYTSVRIQLKRKEAGKLKSGKDTVGQEIEAIVVKNKVARPYETATFTILFGLGIDKETDILTVALDYGIVNKRGAYLVFDGDTIAQGTYNTVQALKENPELTAILEEKCKEVINE